MLLPAAIETLFSIYGNRIVEDELSSFNSRGIITNTIRMNTGIFEYEILFLQNDAKRSVYPINDILLFQALLLCVLSFSLCG